MRFLPPALSYTALRTGLGADVLAFDRRNALQSAENNLDHILCAHNLTQIPVPYKRM